MIRQTHSSTLKHHMGLNSTKRCREKTTPNSNWEQNSFPHFVRNVTLLL